jgi:hypothetical protein
LKYSTLKIEIFLVNRREQCQTISLDLASDHRLATNDKSLIAFTAATVVCAGSQAAVAEFRQSAPKTAFPRSEEKVPNAEIPIAKLDRKGLFAKKMYDSQGNFLGKVVGVTTNDAGEIVSIQLRATVTREARVPRSMLTGMAANVELPSPTGNEELGKRGRHLGRNFCHYFHGVATISDLAL